MVLAPLGVRFFESFVLQVLFLLADAIGTSQPYGWEIRIGAERPDVTRKGEGVRSLKLTDNFNEK